MNNTLLLLRYIPKNSFTELIIPKTKFIFCEISSYYSESKEVIYVGKNNIINLERSIDTNNDIQEHIEIRNTIFTYNKSTKHH